MVDTVYHELQGFTVAFGVHTLLTSAVMSGTFPGVQSGLIPTTTIADTTEKAVPSRVKKIGKLQLVVEYEPSKDYMGARGGVNESITVTLPKLNAASAAAAKLVYFGFIESVGDIKAENGSKPTIELNIHVNGFGTLGADASPFTAEA